MGDGGSSVSKGFKSSADYDRELKAILDSKSPNKDSWFVDLEVNRALGGFRGPFSVPVSER